MAGADRCSPTAWGTISAPVLGPPSIGNAAISVLGTAGSPGPTRDDHPGPIRRSRSHLRASDDELPTADQSTTTALATRCIVRYTRAPSQSRFPDEFKAGLQVSRTTTSAVLSSERDRSSKKSAKGTFTPSQDRDSPLRREGSTGDAGAVVTTASLSEWLITDSSGLTVSAPRRQATAPDSAWPRLSECCRSRPAAPRR